MPAGPSAQSVSGERDSHSLRRKGAGCARHRSRGGASASAKASQASNTYPIKL